MTFAVPVAEGGCIVPNSRGSRAQTWTGMLRSRWSRTTSTCSTAISTNVASTPRRAWLRCCWRQWTYRLTFCCLRSSRIPGSEAPCRRASLRIASRRSCSSSSDGGACRSCQRQLTLSGGFGPDRYWCVVGELRSCRGVSDSARSASGCSTLLYLTAVWLIWAQKPTTNPTAQAAALLVQSVEVTGFEPTASSSRRNESTALASAFQRVRPVQTSLTIPEVRRHTW